MKLFGHGFYFYWWVVGVGGRMCGWMGDWRFWRVRMSQLPSKLKLKLKLGLAILKNTFLGGGRGGWRN